MSSTERLSDEELRELQEVIVECSETVESIFIDLERSLQECAEDAA